MQGSKGDTDTKNRLLDTAGEGAGGLICEMRTMGSECCFVYKGVKTVWSPEALGELGTADETFSAAVAVWGGPQQRFPEKESGVSLALRSK